MSKNSQLNLSKQKLEFITHKSDFIKFVLNFRDKWEIPNNGLKSQSEATLWHKNILKRLENNYKAEIEIFLSKLKLSDYYRKPIEHYLLYNNFDNLDVFNVKLYEEVDKDGSKKILIQIYPETTLEDIKGVWNMVKLMQKERIDDKNKRRRNILYMPKSSRIFELH